MPDLYQDIIDFHEKFGLNKPDQPTNLWETTWEFRRKFMQEELEEYEEAYSNGDPEKMLDALVDLVYVVLGTACMHGFDFNEAWRRVHDANMQKVRASTADQSKRGSTLDVVKPLGWVAPDLSDLVWK